MWVFIRDVILSSVYNFIAANFWTLILTIAALLVGWFKNAIIALFKKVFSSMSTSQQAELSSDLDTIGSLIEQVLKDSSTQVKTLLTAMTADGKISSSELKTLVSSITAVVKSQLSADVIATLEAKYGDISKLILAWTKEKILAKIEAKLAKLKIKLDLDGDGDSGDTTGTTKVSD